MDITEREIMNVIKEEFGEQAILLIDSLKNKTNVSEITLAEKFKKEMNEIRSQLYQLHNFNIAFFNKKKDKDGWYTYHWNIDLGRIKDFAVQKKKNALKNLKKQLKKEEGKIFYICKTGCARLDFVKASEYGFRCPECNEFLDYTENENKIECLKREISIMKD